MIAGALGLWQSRGLIGIVLAGIVVAALGGYALWLRADVAELELDKAAITRDRDTWHDASEANRQAAEAIVAEATRKIDAIAGDHAATVARLLKLSDARKEVADAAKTQDALPAGVLVVARGQLARLRAAPAAAGGDGDQGGKGGSAGRAPHLRP